MNKRIWDAVIVGAGPAGSSLAIRLARSGRMVLLLDKRRFPRTKPCGGLLSSLALKHAPISLTTQIKATPSIIEEHFRNGTTNLSPDSLALVRRIDMDNFLLQAAIQAGVTFVHTAGIRKFSDRTGSLRVTFNDRKWVETRHLIGADGSASKIRRLLKQPPDCPGFALEAELHAEPRSKNLYFDYAAIDNGYGWYFPMGPKVNIGLARFDGRRPQKQELNEFINKHFPASSSSHSIQGGPIRTYANNYFAGCGRVLLIGDAAGLTDDYTGEGISHAFQSAEYAAEALIKSPEQALSQYQYQLNKNIAPMLEKRRQIAAREYRLLAGAAIRI